MAGGNIWVSANNNAAGIGSGEDAECSVEITGGTVTAYGGQRRTGIGSGSGFSRSNVVIAGGTIIAEGGEYSACIGTGGFSECRCSVTLLDGTIKARGKDGAADIGCGYYNQFCSVTDNRSTASILSVGHLEIVFVIGGLAIGLITAMFIFRKKKVVARNTPADDE